ncbi:hypothetical protein [Alistipes timonensis]|uniref:hypothetical protein n=1 Tax=Alistipes timonensis TaxID=1465754 RepID=UPI001C3D0748|nr:hypothetical protein [Alistipes timonensis]MCR2029645.1 hypothetical protein [Alistipes timonensis]
MGILRCTILLLSLSAVCLPAYGRHDEPAASAGTDSPAGPAVEEMRRQRGLVDISHVFVPEGQWIFGGTASYSAHANDDYTFFIVEKINSDGYTFKVSPLIGYALRNNMALGMRFVYGRSLLKVDSGELNLGDEESGTHLTAEYYYSLKHSYSAAAIWRQYIPLGRNRRIALFNEMSLTLGGHQKKFAADSPVRGTYETGYSVSLGVSPGLVAFATNSMAVEVNVGVMGISYTHAHQDHNRVREGDVKSSLMNFKINLLSIGLGVSFYL